MEFSRITSDVLVIGGELAGISAALAAREAGREVVIVAKSKVLADFCQARLMVGTAIMILDGAFGA